MRKMQLPDDADDADDDNCVHCEKKGLQEIEIGNGNGNGTQKGKLVGQLIKANLSDARKYATHEPQRQ